MEPAFDGLHRFLGQRDAFLVDALAKLHDWMKPLPGHAASPGEHGFNIHQLGAIPMLLEDPPATLDGVVLAVRGRDVEEVNGLYSNSEVNSLLILNQLLSARANKQSHSLRAKSPVVCYKSS